MGRRSKPKKQPPRVLRHMHERMLPATEIVERALAPPGGVTVGRLELVPQHFPFDASVVAESLRFRADGHFLCDSTTFLSPTDERIWDVLLRERKIVLISPIIDEIRVWCGDPRGVNVEASKHVKAHLDNNDSSRVQTLDLPPTQELINAAVYYINLLGIRKHGGPIARR